MKKYDVMTTVLGDEKLIMPITAQSNWVKLYTYDEESFKIVHKIHLSIWHGDRNRMECEINKNIKNITRETLLFHQNIRNNIKTHE